MEKVCVNSAFFTWINMSLRCFGIERKRETGSVIILRYFGWKSTCGNCLCVISKERKQRFKHEVRMCWTFFSSSACYNKISLTKYQVKIRNAGISSSKRFSNWLNYFSHKHLIFCYRTFWLSILISNIWSFRKVVNLFQLEYI